MKRFNGHPPLGVNATPANSRADRRQGRESFNGHPPLGVNATCSIARETAEQCVAFQWAPTLGGECYAS